VRLTEQLCAAAPPGQRHLDDAAVRRLQELTGTLIAERAEEAAAELRRFLDVRERAICLPHDELSGALGGAVVLVTGGTGCVGSALIGQLAAYCPARVMSVSRGGAYPWPRYGHAVYRAADIRDAAFRQLVRELSPDVIFHVAGQRDPGLAEVQVHRTVTTNVSGTHNVLQAAEQAGARVVLAGTGKALRPFSADIYTASKRAAEHLVAGAQVPASVVRFTHVADNSIIYQRLRAWAAGGGPVRLHRPDVSFYVQSALEAAQLLLLASLDRRCVRVIHDLGWPVSLLDMALGVLAATGSAAPLYISGYDRGYEEVPFPGLYDPRTAGDVSPLLNAFEAAAAVPSACPMTDVCPAAAGRGVQPAFQSLHALCAGTDDPGKVRGGLRELSWALLDDTLAAVPVPVLERVCGLVARVPDLPAGHDAIFQCMKRALYARQFLALLARERTGPIYRACP